MGTKRSKRITTLRVPKITKEWLQEREVACGIEVKIFVQHFGKKGKATIEEALQVCCDIRESAFAVGLLDEMRKDIPPDLRTRYQGYDYLVGPITYRNIIEFYRFHFKSKKYGWAVDIIEVFGPKARKRWKLSSQGTFYGFSESCVFDTFEKKWAWVKPLVPKSWITKKN